MEHWRRKGVGRVVQLLARAKKHREQEQVATGSFAWLAMVLAAAAEGRRVRAYAREEEKQGALFGFSKTQEGAVETQRHAT